MAFTVSKIFRAFIGDVLGNTAAFDLAGTGIDTFKVALFNNTTTPDQNVAAAASAFNTGVWVLANEVTDATNWVSGGRALVTPVIDVGTSGVVFFDGADLSGGGNVTLSGVMGCLVYDDTLATPVAKQGVCYNYFGGAQSVTAGTFTIAWSANGLFRLTL
jgi:hypothetical protein